MRERPERQGVRRLSAYLKLEGAKKVHSLIDKVYQRKNLELAWEKVRANKGSGGIDEVTIQAFQKDVKAHLERLEDELCTNTYKPLAVRRVEIPKRGDPEKTRPLGIPAIYDRVCQQAVLNRLEPVFEQLFDESSFGYRKGRRTRDALEKIWREIESGNEWIVDADLKDYFGSVDHEKLIALLSQRISDGRVLQLVRKFLQAGYVEKGRLFPTRRGTPQGGVVSPLLSNILLTPFDKEMRVRGYRLTRWADDWVITCRTKSEAVQALRTAEKILTTLGVTLNREKTRIVHIQNGFQFLGFKIQRGKGKYKLPEHRRKTKAHHHNLYARPTDKSVERFKDAVRKHTRRRNPVKTAELIRRLNPVLRGWGQYYHRAQVRRLFNQLDRWIVRRIWSHHYKRWRCAGWEKLPDRFLRSKLGLVSLIQLIPSVRSRYTYS